MTYTFDIYGDIVDNIASKCSPEDICPQDLKDFISSNELKEDDILQLNINSCGGSVQAGLSMVSMLKAVPCKTVSKIDGVAASIASVIACACKELVMSPSSFMMIHRVWTMVQGNSEELRKEADICDKMNDALVYVYKTKFDLSEEEIADLMAKETWISGEMVSDYKLNAIINESTDGMKYAAKLVDKLKKFNNAVLLEQLHNMEKEETKEELNEQQEVVEVVEETTEETVEEQPVEETTEEVVEEKTEETEVTELEQIKKENEELKAKVAELEAKLAECKPDETVEARLAKCQSTFQNKINGFKDEIKAKDEELQKFKDSVSSLNTELEQTKKELHDMSAAFEAKQTALATLNASVLHPSAELPTFKDGLKECKTLKDRVAFISSGKYIK